MRIETLIFGAADAPRPNGRVVRGAGLHHESGGFESHIRTFFLFLFVRFACNPSSFLEDTFFVLSYGLPTFLNGFWHPKCFAHNSFVSRLGRFLFIFSTG